MSKFGWTVISETLQLVDTDCNPATNMNTTNRALLIFKVEYSFLLTLFNFVGLKNMRKVNDD